VASLVFSGQTGRLGSSAVASINGYRALQASYERLLPTIAGAVQRLPDRPTWVLADNQTYLSGPPPRLYVPPLLTPRAVIDLGLPMWAVRNGSPFTGDASSFQIAETAIAYIDVNEGGDPPSFDLPLEVDRVTRVGHVIVAPLLADSGDGLWILELIPADS